jgi:hypothetical protein
MQRGNWGHLCDRKKTALSWVPEVTEQIDNPFSQTQGISKFIILKDLCLNDDTCYIISKYTQELFVPKQKIYINHTRYIFKSYFLFS